MPRSKATPAPPGSTTEGPGVLIDTRRFDNAPRVEAPRPGEWGPAEGPAPAPKLAKVASLSAERRRRREPEAPDEASQTHSPSQPPPAAQARPSEASERRTPSRPPPAPLLASEIMRRDMAPATPASGLARRAAALCGFVGCAAALWLARAAELTPLVAGALLLVGLVGLLPMSYEARAAGLVTLTAGCTTLIMWGMFAKTDPLQSVLLPGGIVMLGSALWFRAWHRGSLLARLLVAMGLGACASWMLRSGAATDLTSLPTEWQHWVPRLLNLPLALLLLLSLLAFMGAESSGGCAVWAGGLVVWYAAREWTRLLAAYWPVGHALPSLEHVAAEQVLAPLCLPLLAPLLAIGLAQLLASAMGERARTSATPGYRPT